MNSGHSSDNRIAWIIPMILIVVAMALYACGKKGDPLPPDIAKPAAISGLTIQKTAEGILLQWLPPTNEISKIKIFRSGLAKEDCPGCPSPRDYRPLAELMLGGKGSVTEVLPLQYMDKDVRTGLFYSYRIVACAQEGVCSDEGDIVEIDY